MNRWYLKKTLFDDKINIKEFYLSLLKMDKNLDKNINIYYNKFIIMKKSDYVKIKSVNPLYLIISDVDVYLKEKIEVNT